MTRLKAPLEVRESHKILLIESPSTQGMPLLCRDVIATKEGTFIVKKVSEAQFDVARLHSGKQELILMDLSSKTQQSLRNFISIRRSFPEIPVVVFTSDENKEIGLEAVQSHTQSGAA